MATQVQFRRGTTGETGSFIGAFGEVTVDTTKNVVVIHNGSTPGGFPAMREDGTNMSLSLGSLSSCAVKFLADPDTGIYSPGSNQVAFVTGGVARLAIDSTGTATFSNNVAITGTLALNGGFTFGLGSAVTPSISFTGDIDTGIYSPGANQIAITTAGVGRLFVDGSGNITLASGSSLVFEGSTNDGFETTLAVVDPTADQVLTLPNVTGTLITTGDTGTITSTMIANGTIVDADISSTAAIIDTKLATISTAGKVSNSATTATSSNTASTIVARDASGNFSAGTITGTFSGSGASLTSLPAGQLTGTIPSGVLGNSNLFVGTTSIALNRASGNQGLTGISSLAMPGASSGTVTLTPAATAGTTAITIPATSGTLITTGDTGTVTSTMILNGTIVDANINASAAIADTKLATISTANKVSNSATTATNLNTANAIVSRDASGNFSAGTVTATTFSGSGASLTSIPASQLTGTISSTVLGNSNLFVGTTSIALNRASGNQGLTGISSLAMPGSTSGTITLTPTAIAGTTAITVPATTGTLVTTGDNGTVTSTMILNNTIVDADINASAAIAGTKISPDFGSQTIATTGIFSHALGTASAPTITFTGDTNTGIYSPGADQVAISTNGTGRLFVDASGRVGIGDTPTSLLDISSTSEFTLGLLARTSSTQTSIGSHPVATFTNTSTASGNGVGARFNIADTSGTARVAAQIGAIATAKTASSVTADIYFAPGATERLRITSAGLVGIGTSSPGEKLTVAGNISLSAAQPYIALIDSVWGSGSTFRSGVNTLGTATGDYQLFNVPTGKGFAFAQNNATNSLVIDSSGRLLVGTSSALSNISIAGTLAAPTFQIQGATGGAASASITRTTTGPGYLTFSAGSSGNNVANNTGLGAIQFNGFDGTNYINSASISSAVDGIPGTDDMPGRIVLSTTADGASSPTERLRITSAGRVGIGTTSPNAPLCVNGLPPQTGIISAVAASGGRSLALSDNINCSLYVTHLAGGVVIGTDSGNAIRFATNGFGSSDEKARIDSSGRLLIGTSSARTNYLGGGTAPSVQLEATNFPGSALALTRNETSGAGAGLLLGRTRGASNGSNTAVIQDDGLGIVSFQGVDGTNFIEGARISAAVDGTPGANDMPGRLVFSTTADGASSPTERLRITSAGNVGVGTTSPATALHVSTNQSTVSTFQTSGADLYLRFQNSVNTGGYVGYQSNALTLWTTDAERARIDSSGRLLVGTSSGDTFLQSAFQIAGSGFGGTQLIMRHTTTTATDASTLWLARTRGSSASSRTIVSNGDELGRVSFFGADGSTIVEAAAITAAVDGTPGANDMPGRLVFSTTADGASSPTERLRIDSNGFARYAGAIGRGAPVTKTGAFTVGIAENWLICNGTASITVTLPTASAWTGREIMLKTIAAFTVVSASSNVVPLAGGAAGTAILAATAGRFATLVSDGTNWIIMQAN